MLTQSQLDELNAKLIEMKKEHEDQLYGGNNNTSSDQRAEDTGELSSIDNHPGDAATEMFEREKDTALNNMSREKLAEIDNALEAIENGTYGICEIGGEEIQFERLQAVPETRRCIKHADSDVDNDRPVEEDVIDPTIKNKNDREEVIFDRGDSWETVSEYGNSQSPSDVPNEDEVYGSEGDSTEDPGKSDSVEDKPVADLEGKDTGITYEQKEHNDGSRNRYEQEKRDKRLGKQSH